MAKSQAEKRLEKEKRELQAKLDAAEAEKDEAKAKLAGTKSFADELKKRYRTQLAKTGGRGTPNKAKNKGMVMQIKKVTKRFLWKSVKFIGNDKQLQEAAMMVLDRLQIKDLTHTDGESEATAEEIDLKVDDWLATFSPDVRSATNDQRSYVQSEMKKLALQWLKDGKELPPASEFIEIAKRNVLKEGGEVDPDKEALFDLYLLFVSAVAGSHTFGEKQRRSEPLSVAVDTTGKLAVPAGTEAMALVMYENCHQKWLNMHDHKVTKGMAGDIPKYSSRRHEDTKQWMAKYSDSCSGNSPYGGWGKEGIKRFTQLRKQIKELRRLHAATILDTETDAMKRFSDAYEAERKRKRRANGASEEELEEEASGSATKKQKSSDDDEDVLAEFESDDE